MVYGGVGDTGEEGGYIVSPPGDVIIVGFSGVHITLYTFFSILFNIDILLI